MERLLQLLMCLSPLLTIYGKELVLEPPGPRLRVTGSSAVVCYVKGDWGVPLREEEVEWVDPDGEVLQFYDRRLEVSGHTFLVFREEGRDDVKDTGTYTCRATIAGRTVKKTILVDFSDDPAVGIYPSENNSISRIEGTGELVLTCKAVGYPASDTKLEWLDPNNRTIGHDQPAGRIHAEQLSLRTRLKFDDVKVEDHGLYTCRVTTGGLTILKHVQLNVYGISILPSQSPLRVKKHTGIELRCQVTKPSGARHVTVQWMYSFSKIVPPYNTNNTNRMFVDERPMESTLYIDDLADGDNTTHTCQVNMDGNTLTRDISLQFYDPPESVITPSEESIRRMADTTTSMYCKSKGLSDVQLQHATFEWLDQHDNVIGPYIEDDPIRNRFYAMHLPEATRLQLDQLTSGERGTFSCRCTVGGDIMISDIQLIVYGKPDAPTNIQATMTDSRSITITWDEGYNGDSKQRFIIQYRQVYEQRDEQWTTHPTMPRENNALELTLGGLKPSSVYEIRINAVNEYGSSGYTSVNMTTV